MMSASAQTKFKGKRGQVLFYVFSFYLDCGLFLDE